MSGKITGKIRGSWRGNNQKSPFRKQMQSWKCYDGFWQWATRSSWCLIIQLYTWYRRPWYVNHVFDFLFFSPKIFLLHIWKKSHKFTYLYSHKYVYLIIHEKLFPKPAKISFFLHYCFQPILVFFFQTTIQRRTVWFIWIKFLNTELFNNLDSNFILTSWF